MESMTTILDGLESENSILKEEVAKKTGEIVQIRHGNPDSSATYFMLYESYDSYFIFVLNPVRCSCKSSAQITRHGVEKGA